MRSGTRLVVGFVGLVGLAVTGCATLTPGPDDRAEPVTVDLSQFNAEVRVKVEQMVVDAKKLRVEFDEKLYADLVVAGRIANEEPPPDPVAGICFPVMAQKVRQRIDATGGIRPVGPFSFFEKANKVIFPLSVPDETLKMSCSALVQRTIIKAAQIIAQVAGLVSSMGTSAAGSVAEGVDKLKKILSVLHTLGMPIPLGGA